MEWNEIKCGRWQHKWPLKKLFAFQLQSFFFLSLCMSMSIVAMIMVFLFRYTLLKSTYSIWVQSPEEMLRIIKRFVNTTTWSMHTIFLVYFPNAKLLFWKEHFFFIFYCLHFERHIICIVYGFWSHSNSR